MFLGKKAYGIRTVHKKHRDQHQKGLKETHDMTQREKAFNRNDRDDDRSQKKRLATDIMDTKTSCATVDFPNTVFQEASVFQIKKE
mmetsp:Transcript_28200/g.43225  ORF Transcript_28200/g.43225 Transcript_28200/m.43225 type:complete len:86 (-) Transcript_28200:2963-3220(-)